MAAWLCVTNRENFKIIRDEKMWGVSERHAQIMMGEVKVDDLCVFYLKGEGPYSDRKKAGIGGIFTVISAPFRDYSDTFTSKPRIDELYPCRVHIQCVKIFEPEMPFRPLVAKINFIKRKNNYGTYIFGRAMRKLSDTDMNIIFDYLGLTQRARS